MLADLWLAAGRPSKARRLCAQALELAEAHGAPVARATAELHVGLSEIDVEAGDLESAKRHLETAAALGDRAAMTESRYRWFVAMGLARPSRRRPGRGRQPPGPGRAALPSGLLPGRATHRGHQGPDLDRAGQAVGGRRLGPGPRRVRHRRRQLSEGVRPPHPRAAAPRAAPGAPGHRRPRPGSRPVGPAVRRPPRPPGAPAVSSRSACCRPWPTTRRDIGRRPWRPGPSLGAGTRTRGLRPALPGRGRSHAEPAARRRACRASPATTRVACSASAHRPKPQAPDSGQRAGAAVGRVVERAGAAGAQAARQ